MMGNSFPASELKTFAEKVLYAGGFSKNESRDIAESLVLSELMGHGSHGLVRVKEYLGDLKKGATVSGAELKVVRETPNSLYADAQRCVGQTVMPKIMDMVLKKLETQAIVTASVRNSAHIGRIGEWVEKPANKGFPGLLLVNDNGSFFAVAPPGGKKPVTSTNPVAFAIPLPDGKIFLADMSTGAVAFGKVKLARINGKQMPEDSIQDADGHMTTDPNALFGNPRGSIMPMGGAQAYKGFALSMFIDMLVSGLAGGNTPPAPDGIEYANNISLTLWNPEFFAGLSHMQQEAQKYIEYVRHSPPTDPSQPIRLAGDRLAATKADREAGGIPLDEGLRQELTGLAKSLNVTPPARMMAA